MFLEEYKYLVKEIKFHNYTIDNVHNSSDSDEEDLLEKNSNYEENSDE